MVAEGGIGRLLCGLPLVAALLLAGCSSSSDEQLQASIAPPANDTNAPAFAGTQIAPGSEEDLMVNVGRRTFFAEGSASLDDTAMRTLDSQADWLLRYPQWKVKLQGFSDDPGGPEDNRVLSQRRADAVRDYLVARGVSRDRMLAKGYGRDRLVQDCEDISCKSQNRRVITNPQDAPEF